jgi:hypothetical protein
VPIRKTVRSKVRLRVLLPLVGAIVVAAAGLAVLQLDLLDKIGLGSDENESKPVAAEVAPAGPSASGSGGSAGESAGETTAPAQTTAPAEGDQPAAASESAGMDALEAELEEHKVVVLVVSSPQAAVDSIVTLEARLGADAAGAGFLAVNSLKENEIGSIATEYDVRDTPAVLVFRRGPELVKKFLGYADRVTVAQAAQSAKATA